MSIRTTDKNDRVMVFLDLANVQLGLANHEGLENCITDHKDLATILIDGRKVAGAMAFDVREYFNNNAETTDDLSDMGYKIVIGHMEDGKQKEVDVALTVEMLMHAVRDHYDVAILVSGDRDFIPVISEVQSLGKKVEVASFSRCTSRRLIEISDKYTDLGSLPIVEYFEPDMIETYDQPDRLEIYDELEPVDTEEEFIDVFELIGAEEEFQEAN